MRRVEIIMKYSRVAKKDIGFYNVDGRKRYTINYNDLIVDGERIFYQDVDGTTLKNMLDSGDIRELIDNDKISSIYEFYYNEFIYVDEKAVDAINEMLEKHNTENLNNE
jgi:hypothetical protein